MLIDCHASAYAKPKNKAYFRQNPEHFKVNETLNFTPSGEGEHLYLYIEKRNTNSHWLADELARRAGLNPKDVGYAGRKDRIAVTRQWFSLQIPESRDVDFSVFSDNDFRLIHSTRHTHKLRKGCILFNEFKLQLTECEGSFDEFKTRASLIAKEGFPNYFGAQRFGHNRSNIDKAKAMLSGRIRVKDRNKRSIYLSAARSYLFNKVLSKRIEMGIHKTAIRGDIFWDNHRYQLIDAVMDASNVQKRVTEGSITITGPLPGDGANLVTDDALLLETEVLETESEFCKGIADSRIDWHRRPIWIIPQQMYINTNEQGFCLSFLLNTGAYATSLLRELIEIKNTE